jgi:NAD(P)-dependent dehydrogenase (short-subunit alcohol dehydrogenase family)
LPGSGRRGLVAFQDEGWREPGRRHAAQLPVRRPGLVEDIAAAALFLASPDAGFITGELMNVNGGRVFGR